MSILMHLQVNTFSLPYPASDRFMNLNFDGQPVCLMVDYSTESIKHARGKGDPIQGSLHDTTH